ESKGEPPESIPDTGATESREPGEQQEPGVEEPGESREAFEKLAQSENEDSAESTRPSDTSERELEASETPELGESEESNPVAPGEVPELDEADAGRDPDLGESGSDTALADMPVPFENDVLSIESSIDGYDTADAAKGETDTLSPEASVEPGNTAPAESGNTAPAETPEVDAQTGAPATAEASAEDVTGEEQHGDA
ncbi:MAG: hypothetical protein ACPG4T_03565, partial [Nannocystaceae bacterium]